LPDELEYLLTLGFPAGDIDAMERIVLEHDSLVFPTSDAAELQSIAHLRYAAMFENFDVRVLLDNNIYTRVVAAARGENTTDLSDGPNHRSAIAALMSFFQMANIDIEPGIALFEKAYSAPHQEVIDQFNLFQIADEVQTSHWTDLALGRTSHLRGLTSASQRAASRGTIEPSRFEHKVQPFLSAYFSILKLIEMQRMNGTGVDVLIDFMIWMKDEAIFDGMTLLLAMYHFGPKKTGSRIKRSGAERYEKVVKGAKNAAWDSTYIRRWTKVSQESDGDSLWLLCTNDYELREIARSWVNDEDQALEKVAAITFGQKEGAKLLENYNTIWSEIRSDGSQREQMKQVYWNSLEARISAAEANLQQTF